MRFIKANKVLVIVIGIAILFIAVIGLLATQTGVFDSDAKLFNDIEKTQKEDKNKGDSKGEMSGVVKPAPEIEAIVDNPGGRETIEEGTPEEIDAKKFWAGNNLIENEGDSSKYRDMKRELRITSYEDFKQLESEGVKNVEIKGNIQLGEAGMKEIPSEVLYKNNDIVDFGDFRVVGARVDNYLDGVWLSIQNRSGELIDANELLKDIEMRYKYEGRETEYINFKDDKKPFDDVEDYKEGSIFIEAYIGRGLTKEIPLLVGIDEFLDIYGRGIDLEENIKTYYSDSLGVRYEDNFDIMKEFQRELPEAITITIKYNKQEEEYTLLKSEDILIYRELQQ